MSSRHLFGDAKATAKAADVQRKRRLLLEAKSRFEEDPNEQTQAALATALFDVGRFAEAERLIVDLLKTRGNDIRMLFDLAFVYKNLDQPEKARATFREVVELDPKHPLARGAENELWAMDPNYRPSWLRH